MFERLIQKLMWFYDNIISEPDRFMVFYYSISIHSLLIIFYVWGILNLTGIWGSHIFEGYCIVACSIFLINILFFSKRREAIMQKYGVRDKFKINALDILIFAYVFGSIAMAVFSLEYSKSLAS